MSDITWLGNRTIMYKGRIAELDGVEDGWAAVRAMQRIDAQIESEIDGMVEDNGQNFEVNESEINSESLDDVQKF